MSDHTPVLTPTRAPAPLDRARALLEPALRDAIAVLPQPTRLIANYHLGWTDALGAPAPPAGGKYLRGALVLASARAVGGDHLAGLLPATALELIHNFSLLHDDVMDDDRTRRGRPSAWTVFGAAEALLTGDALLALGYSLLGTNDAQRVLTQELSTAVFRLVDGQAADLALERQASTDIAACLRMVRGKTAALIAGGCALGALAVGAPPEVVAALRGYGEQIGVAFQIVDDLLGLRGDPGVTGKPVGADIRRRKKTVPVAAALNAHGEPARRLAAIYGRDDPLDDAAVTEATALVGLAGGVAWAEREIDRRLLAAAGCLAAVRLDTDGTGDLAVLSDAVARRSR